MCTSLRYWMVLASLSPAVSACGGDLVLPEDKSPAALIAVSGDGQEGTVGSRLAEPLIVRVTDANSQGLEGIAVEFHVDNDAPEAEVTPTQAFTDGNGEAAAEVRLGTDTGPLTVQAQVTEASSSELRTSFDLTAVAEEKGKKGGKGDDDDRGEEDDD